MTGPVRWQGTDGAWQRVILEHGPAAAGRAPTARSVMRNIFTRSAASARRAHRVPAVPLHGRLLHADAAALLPAPARRQAPPRVAVAAPSSLPLDRRAQPGPVWRRPRDIVRPAEPAASTCTGSDMIVL